MKMPLTTKIPSTKICIDSCIDLFFGTLQVINKFVPVQISSVSVFG